MPSQALYTFLQSICMIRMARIRRLLSYYFVGLPMDYPGPYYPHTTIPTRLPRIPQRASESCLSEEHMSEYDRQDFRRTYSRDLSISCRPIL